MIFVVLFTAFLTWLITYCYMCYKTDTFENIIQNYQTKSSYDVGHQHGQIAMKNKINEMIRNMEN